MFFGGGHAIVFEAHAGIPIEKGLGPPENSIMQSDGDHCTLCRKEFVRGNIYGGVTESGSIELVGECCVRHLKEVFVVGLLFD
jgi:hypothetical protein